MLRQLISRLVRKTLSFSKRAYMLNLHFNLFAYQLLLNTTSIFLKSNNYGPKEGWSNHFIYRRLSTPDSCTCRQNFTIIQWIPLNGMTFFELILNIPTRMLK